MSNNKQPQNNIPQKSLSIQTIRNQIDSIDNKLLSLIAERSQLIPLVKEIKKNEITKIRPLREVEIFHKINNIFQGLYQKNHIQKIWRELISATLLIEGDLSFILPKNKNLPTQLELTKYYFSNNANYLIAKNLQDCFQQINQHPSLNILVSPPSFHNKKKWWLLYYNFYYKNHITPQPIPKITMALPLTNSSPTLFLLSNSKIEEGNNNISYFITSKSFSHKDFKILDSNTKYNFISTDKFYTNNIVINNYELIFIGCINL